MSVQLLTATPSSASAARKLLSDTLSSHRVNPSMKMAGEFLVEALAEVMAAFFIILPAWAMPATIRPITRTTMEISIREKARCKGLDIVLNMSQGIRD